ncbi:ABC transporter ATP-binding protein [Brumimicrobium aurantiacum]|uniref:ABC transporter ATP-binding protein n=1 Tax=Brumimicrobium aurantiacum TaxID=1737063 RepID=A0A3E1EZF9_9FLAO|nr:ABC transporter ATP-binding protein [Brumimicrobium aurantiacum]RFC54936.1 ABC transporter ATP-binding protein [Brumimicrobium aurantiacum]
MSLKAENISFSYIDQKMVFKDISFTLQAGEILSIVGPSGTGKSSLLKCLAGLIPLNSGKIYFEDELLPNPRDLLIPGHPEIALVNQLFKLDEYFSVRENISNQLHHLNNEDRKEFTNELLEIFELESLSEVKSREISGGEQQRLSMACALAKEPKCLFLDEPFVHLDVHLNKKIEDYIRELAKVRNMSVVLVTHNGVEALSWSDRIMVMSNGEIKSNYTPHQAYFKPKNLFEGRFFGELNSVYINKKQVLFRPNEYTLMANEKALKIDVSWKNASFKGTYFANYFRLENGKTIVLYADEELKKTKEIYVTK